eukprot:TRINITY_DN30723_c0_g1_i1.p1 TRINITY_DN30723_c0_g1~~TRINITY_DN30723_c0_g1_i1.p1  ORF type:complete len:815 (-),score=121.92 TRINITY_DN30723_c0_g1_i1:117-2477(-)
MVLDFAEDLPEDVLSRAVVSCRAPDALAFAAASRAMMLAADATAQRLFASIFGSAELPSNLCCSRGGRPRLFVRLDRVRSEDSGHVRESFSWASGLGYQQFIVNTFAACTARGWSSHAQQELLNGRQAGQGQAAELPPLCHAAKKRQTAMVSCLLEMRADPERPGGKGSVTPLFWAARHGDVVSLQCLLDAGASPLTPTAAASIPPPAASNSASGGPSRAGCVSKRTLGGECALSAVLQSPLAEPSPSRVEALQLMSNRLTFFQKSEALACKTLLGACQSGSAPYVAALLDCGIGPTAAPPRLTGMARSAMPAAAMPAIPSTPLPTVGIGLPDALSGIAVQVAHRSSRAHATGSNPVPERAAADLAAAAAGEVGELQETPLLAAVSCGFSEVAALLLEKQPHALALINATLPSGKTALHLAAEKGDAHLTQLLLRANAHVDAATSSGRSALYFAVEHAHVETVRAICKHDGTLTRHLLQQTPNGVSPITLAERRGKPSVILPMLRCYHKHLRRRYLAGKLGDAGDNVSDSGLTTLCFKYRDYLFTPDHDSDDHCSQSRGISFASKLARLKLKSEPGFAESGNSASSQSAEGGLGRHQRVLDQTTWNGADPTVCGRGRLRSQMDLPASEASSNDRAHARCSRPRSASAQRSQGSAAAAPPVRKPWGSAAPRRRPSTSNSARGGQSKAFAMPSGHLLQTAEPASATVCLPSLIPARTAYGSELPGQLGPDRYRAAVAMAADDAMEDLMAGFLSDSDGEEAPLCSTEQTPLQFGDSGLYSSDESNDEMG